MTVNRDSDQQCCCYETKQLSTPKNEDAEVILMIEIVSCSIPWSPYSLEKLEKKNTNKNENKRMSSKPILNFI